MGENKACTKIKHARLPTFLEGWLKLKNARLPTDGGVGEIKVPKLKNARLPTLLKGWVKLKNARLPILLEGWMKLKNARPAPAQHAGVVDKNKECIMPSHLAAGVAGKMSWVDVFRGSLPRRTYRGVSER